jgi:hypothetical protein
LTVQIKINYQSSSFQVGGNGGESASGGGGRRHASSGSSPPRRSVQRQVLTRLLAGISTFLAGLLAIPFQGKILYMMLIGLVGIVGGIVLAIVLMGKRGKEFEPI